MADDKSIDFKALAEGDIVIYKDELYRVNVVDNSIKTIYIANINGGTKATADELTYVGHDTLSAIAVKEMKPKAKPYTYRWRCGDWVRNEKLGLVGEVIENRDGLTKCEVNLSDGFKLYWWPQSELTTELAPYRGSTSHTPYTSPGYDPLQKYGDDLSRRRAAPVQKEKKKPGLDLSTAGLIKNEVSKLEKEQKSRPLNTSAPTKKKDDGGFEGPSKPVPKRKGDW